MAVGIFLNSSALEFVPNRQGIFIDSATFSGYEDTRCLNQYPAYLDYEELDLTGQLPGSFIYGLVVEEEEAIPSIATTPLNINCGSGDPFVANNGWEFLTDRYFVEGTSNVVHYTRKNKLYNKYREQRTSTMPLTYEIPLRRGYYDVTLYFADNPFPGIDQREFGVTVNDVLIKEDFDVVLESGDFRQVTKVNVNNVRRVDGMIKIELKGSGNDKVILNSIRIDDA